ncbi:vWA domain-containing protein [Brevibacillus sp. 179-C 1.1 NHS]|uniref:vWA domain-containing protein n=1 Tax=Brevibacillus sp. 179-C 1.1 NHS TaxID=3235177 RepID=UPI0039A3ED00
MRTTHMRKLFWVNCCLIMLLITGCSLGAAGAGPGIGKSQWPQSAQELIASEPGPLAGTQFYHANYPHRAEIGKILDKMPTMVDGMNEEYMDLYWNQLLTLFSEDYLSPQMVVDRWRMASYGSPDIEDARFQFRENFNVEIILDASGSMAGKIGDKTKMQLAKEAIKEFAEALPKEAKISLRVYGHKGSNADEHKQLSCSSSDLIFPLQSVDSKGLKQALELVEPTGWTSIAHSLRLAQQDLAAFEADKNTNIIYLVSDGIETCDGDPVAVAKELSQSKIMPLLNVIGFDVNTEGQKQLKEIAHASEGLYANVTNREQFKQELERAREIAEKWEQWKRDALTEADAVLIDRKKWIDAYDRDWYEKNWRESLNIGLAIEYLSANGKIGSQAREYLTGKRQEREALATQSKEELTNYLVSLTTETYQEMREEIEEKYSGN